MINFDKDNKYKIIIILSHSGPMEFIMKSFGFYEKNTKNIFVADQIYFDISKGIQNYKFLESIGVH